jgi:phosphatidylserine decarboxylase
MMPRPHLTPHLSLHRFKSSSSAKQSADNSRSNSRAGSPRRRIDEQGGDNKGTGLILRVQVLKGRNLAPKDKNGTSDPVGSTQIIIIINSSR